MWNLNCCLNILFLLHAAELFFSDFKRPCFLISYFVDLAAFMPRLTRAVVSLVSHLAMKHVLAAMRPSSWHIARDIEAQCFPLGRCLFRHTSTTTRIESTGTWFRCSCTKHLVFQPDGCLCPIAIWGRFLSKRCAGHGMEQRLQWSSLILLVQERNFCFQYQGPPALS